MNDLLRHRLATALVGGGLLLTAGGSAVGLTAATAASTTIVAADPIAMAITTSQAVVPAGAASNVVVVDAADPVEQVIAGAALAGLPEYVPLLLSPTEGLPAEVRAELDRAVGSHPSPVAYLVGGFAPSVVAGLEADGWAVIDIAGATALDTSLALADATYGVPVGTSQRVVVVSDRPEDVYQSSVAAVYAANVGIPVLAVGEETVTLQTQVRDAYLVADPEVVTIDQLDLPAAPSADAPGGVAPGVVTHTTFWGDPASVAEQIEPTLLGEPADGDLRGWLAPMPVIVEVSDAAVAPIAAMVAARRSLDGHPAALSADLGDLSVEGATHLDLLGSGAEPAEPAPAPLPATGGGIAALGLAITATGLLLRRRSPRTES